MAVEHAPLIAFNRGVVSPLALARIDLKRMAMSAVRQENYIPRVLGSMMLRPGRQWLAETQGDTAARYIPFLFAPTDTALLELTNNSMRVLVNDALITRAAVSSAVTNGNFATNLSGWTNDSQVGGTVTWAAAGQVNFQGDGTNRASLQQAITVAPADQATEHALRITVLVGDVYLRVGTVALGEDLVSETQLLPGTHSIAFTPNAATFYIEILSRQSYPSTLGTCNVEGAGTLTLPTIWPAASFNAIRYDQSADVVFVACSGYRPQRIERRSTTSWSVCNYVVPDGPFGLVNVTPTTLTPSALLGLVTITASNPIFDAGYIGRLLAIASIGQTQTLAASADNVFSTPIEVTGVTAQRGIGIVITGTFSGTVTLQQSIGAPGSWVDVTSWTAPISTSYNDGLSNQIVYYRIGIKTGNYTSGTANCTLSFSAGSLTGIGEVVTYTDSTHVQAIVRREFGATTASSDWYLGDWSTDSGWPSAVALYQGRLFWAGKGKVWGSISGVYDSMDIAAVGDSAPINEDMGSGMVDDIEWLMPGTMFLLGAQDCEWVARSDALDGPLTPTNFNLKKATTRGSTSVGALRADQSMFFVGRTGTRVYEVASDVYSTIYNLYNAHDLTVLCPDLLDAGIVRCAVQRFPDTRLHFVLADGTAAILVFDSAEDVRGWVTITGQGLIKDVVVIPGTPGAEEDQVYYATQYTINGATKMVLEKWSLESECTGQPIAKHLDAHTHFTSGVQTTTITGLAAYNGASVLVWAWNTIAPFTFTDVNGNVNTIGRAYGPFTVAGGQITLPDNVTDAVVGFGYSAYFQSTKLAFAAQMGTALNQKKRLDHLGLILNNTHALGLRYGPDFNTLDNLPLMEAGAAVDSNAIWGAYDYDAMEFNGTYDTDSRLCLQSDAPYPCTILGATASLRTNEKS